MLTLSKKLVAGIAAIAAVAIAAPQAQAVPAGDFFGTPTTVTDDDWSATGIGSTPDPLILPLSDWTGDLFAVDASQAIFTVSRGLSSIVDNTYNGDGSFELRYSVTSTNPIKGITSASLALDLVGLNPDLSATGIKEIYSDAAFTNLLGTSAVTILGGIEDSTDAIFAPTTTIWVKDIIDIDGGSLSSVTNSFEAVPEPMTLLGVSAAAAFGAAFKRRQAKKG
ncbi:MAG: PEP-CTERM sorting domain-containing protein [Cyanobacteriota bacterium]|jgi:hypothetical protein